MRFKLSEVWRSSTGRRGVVTRIEDDGWQGHLLFEDGEETDIHYHALTGPGQWQLDESGARPARSAEELRSIVVHTAARHPVWPPGMDVAVRAKGAGRWGIDGVPPPNTHIAYVDATKHAANVALAYSCLFDLAAA